MIIGEQELRPAKHTPPTMIAGRTSRLRLKPHMVTHSHSGTITDRKGSWRPTMALMRLGSKPDTCPATMTGTPMAPKRPGRCWL